MKIIAPLKVDMLLSATSDLTQTTDHRGQIILLTGMYRWADGTVRDAAEPIPGDIDLSTEEVEEEYENVESEELQEEVPPSTLKNPPRQLAGWAEHYYDGPVDQSKVA